MLADRDRAATEDPPIAAPDAIVLTGDLIQGAPLGLRDYGAALDDQYAVAAEFLELLADNFLGGDRARLAVLRGNHDIDWNGARAAMEPVADEDIPDRFDLRACGAISDLRWSWPERRVYRIVDRSLYDTRLARFDQLITDFYAGTHLLHRPLFRLHDLNEGRIALFAFDSCLGNDCYAFHGKIDQRAIADAYMQLRALAPQLAVAAWHHSIDGEPAATDYMSPSTVEELIGKGFRLGMHGHQHRSAATNHYVHLPDRQEIAVVSAGSLCAAGLGLPTGVNRQYNLIEIADDLISARVHVREMIFANTFAPANRTEFGFNTYLDLDWQLPPVIIAHQAGIDNARILEAEKALAAADYTAVEAILTAVSTESGSYARDLLRTALQEQKAWDRLIAVLDPPATIAELSDATMALAELGDHDRAAALLEAHGTTLGLSGPDAERLRAFIAAKRALADGDPS